MPPAGEGAACWKLMGGLLAAPNKGWADAVPKAGATPPTPTGAAAPPVAEPRPTPKPPAPPDRAEEAPKRGGFDAPLAFPRLKEGREAPKAGAGAGPGEMPGLALMSIAPLT